MTRSALKFFSQLYFEPYFGRALLVLYFILVELSKSEVASKTNYACREAGTTTFNCRVVGTTTTSTCRPFDIPPEAPTQIHTPQLSLVVQSGDNVCLPCRVHNLGVNQVLWRHGNEIVAGSNLTAFRNDKVRLLTGFTLELTRVASKDEGIYQCIVTSWPPLSIVHTIRVIDPITLNIEPDTGIVTVTEGDRVQIGCIPRGNPTPQIAWSKREGTIPLHPSWLTKTQLVIENVSARETGVYICRADNRVTGPVTGSIYVRVLHAPEVETPKRRVHGGVKQVSQLLCVVHADPKPEVQWLFEQKPVPFSGRVFTEIKGNEYYLKFRSVHRKDFGSYLCVGNNSLGYATGHIEFTGVPNAPVVTRWETSPCLRQTSGGVDGGDAEAASAVPDDDDDSSGCTVKVRLFWVVECYSSLIDYRLHFRGVTMNQPVTSANEDQAQVWLQLTIPADPTSPSTFLHSKSYTIHGLPNNSMFEGAVRVRNKFGWSFLSQVFYFTSEPNSRRKINEIGEVLANSPNEEIRKNGRPTPGPEYDDPEDTLETNSFSSRHLPPLPSQYLVVASTSVLIFSKFVSS